MLHFLHPIWLLAGGGIVIPVIIHLWNIKKAKVLRVGSTFLMKEATHQRASRLRISQWLLLVLRCLLIISLSMFLAVPQWRESISGDSKGWVIIEKEKLASIYLEYKTPIDSLIKAGYEIHELRNGFNKMSLHDTGSSLQDNRSGLQDNRSGLTGTNSRSRDTTTEKSETTENDSYWTLISKLDRQLPAGFPVHVFSADMHYKSGNDNTNSGLSMRPATSLNFRWSMLKSDSVSPTPVPIHLQQLSNGTYQVTSLISETDGNYFLRTATNSPFSSNLPADTTVRNITIYNGKDPEDARYLEAAIKAIASFGKYKIKLTNTQSVQEIPTRQDWLFWLSEEKPASNFQAVNLFLYQPGKPAETHSWITTGDGPVDYDAIKTYKLIDSISGLLPPKILWKDGFGNSLLTVENGPTNIYSFYSRFDPAWSDLCWSAAFPKMLYPILIADPVKDKADQYDNRLIAPEQAMPTIKKTTYKEERTVFETTHLNKIFWIIAFLLFVAERFLSMNSQNNKVA